MTRHVAFLRGINLGSRRRVGMAELRDLLEREGYEDVSTFLQSGNVLLTSSTGASSLAGDLTALVSKAFGADIDVIVRSKSQLARIIDNDPFGKAVKDPKLYQVTFLAKRPPKKATDEIEKADIEPERVSIKNREIYAWHPTGIQRSVLAGMLTSDKLGVPATARNWNTITKLLAKADD